MHRKLKNGKPTIFSARVISLGRITIPDELRSVHRIEVGDIVEFEIRSIQKTPNPKKKEA